MITECASRKECIEAIRENGGVGIYQYGTWLACHADEAEQHRTDEHLDNLVSCDWVEPEPEQKGQIGLI